MTIINAYIPDPLADCLTMISDAFKKDKDELLAEVIRKGLDTYTSNNFEELVPALVKETEEYLKAYDDMPE